MAFFKSVPRHMFAPGQTCTIREGTTAMDGNGFHACAIARHCFVRAFWCEHGCDDEHDLAEIRLEGRILGFGNDVRTIGPVMTIIRILTSEEKHACGTGVVFRPNGVQEWYKDGKLHRDDDLPAVIRTNGKREWYRLGKLHRDNNLPAVVYADESRAWFVHGKFQRLLSARQVDALVP